MGYADKIRKLCALRGLDQSALADQVGVSKSSMSRIVSGMQEPKLGLAHELARALGVTLDYLVDESDQGSPGDQMVELSDDERTILKIVRRLGHSLAIDRLVGINVPAPRHAGSSAQRAAAVAGRSKRSRRRSTD
jgi:transcriptional regulator with XRE-family HTH domain